MATSALAAIACGATHRNHATHAASGCRPTASAILRATAHKPVAAVRTPPQLGLTGCTYRLGPPAHPTARVAVTIDRNPQGFARFNRAVEETDQVSLWSTQPSQSPRMLTGVALGADWIPGSRQLMVSDGHAFVTILVTGRTLSAQTLAVAVARATLSTRSGR